VRNQERDLSEPDRIVGELLQPGGVQALRRLGLVGTNFMLWVTSDHFICKLFTDCLDGIDAIDNYGYGVFYDGNDVHLPYPKQPNSEKLEWGRSFHHGRFIMKLREACLAHPK
jgi:squalene monooxygenase